MYYTYIIYNKKHDKFYIGQTNNLLERLNEHNNHISGYTSKYSGKWELKYTEEFKTRNQAIKRERFLKK